MNPQEVRSNYMKQVVYQAKKNELHELSNKYAEATDRSSKIQLTKQMKALEIELQAEKDTFEMVHYITPEKVLERVVGKLNQIVEGYQKALAEFVERVQQNAADAISWRGNSIVSEEEKSHRASAILAYMNKYDNPEEIINAYLDVFNRIKEEGTRQIMSRARNGGNRSTSQYHNIVEDSKICGLAELFEDWQLGEVEYYLDMINNYKILKEAGLLTEE